MNVVQPPQAAITDGRSLVTLTALECPEGSQTVIGPVFYPKPTYGAFKPTSKPTSPLPGQPPPVGFWQCWPNNNPWKDAVAWWNGTAWEGSAGEIQNFSLPGVMRSLSGTIPGVRGREVWPDPAVTVNGVVGAKITVIVFDAPAESLVIGPGCDDCDFYIVGSANAVRVHGNRSMVMDKSGGKNRIHFLNPECPGQLGMSQDGSYPALYGSGRCLSVLSDAGAWHVDGRGVESQGGLMPGDVRFTRLPRLTPIVGWGTCGPYLDDGASGIDCGQMVCSGFEKAGVVGGGSENDLSGVTGGPIWVEDRSHWAQLKDWLGVPARPFKNVVA